MDKEKETRITLRLPADVAEGLRKQAEQDKRSLNSEIVVALEEFLARKKKSRAKQ